MAAHTESRRRTRSEMLADIPGAIISAIQGRNVRFISAHVPVGEVPEHSHEELQITVLFEPATCVIHAAKSKPVTVHGPAVVMIPPRLPHACLCERSGDAIVFYVERRLQERLLPEGSSGMHVASPTAAQDILLWQFATVLRQLNGNPNPTEVTLMHLVAESVVTRAVDVIGREQVTLVRSLTSALLDQVEKFVRSELAYDIHVDDLAKCVGYSVPHFSTLFKAAKGITPADYLFRCRMIRADELLRTGNHLIGEVAKLVGYLDQGHFTALFREFFGYAPKAVLQQVRVESSNRPKIS